MPNLDEKLAKSLDEIDALAEEVLSKSLDQEELENAEEKAIEEKADEKNEEVEKALKPGDVSSDDDDADNDDDKDSDADDDSDDDDDKDDDKDDDDTKKSLADEFAKNETIAKSLEVSDFLSEFTKVNGGILDTLRADINKSLETSTHTATILAKSFGAIMKSQEQLTSLVKSQASLLKDQEELVKSLQSRLDDVERQPVQRKAVVNAIEKSFNHSAGISSATEQTLTKSQLVEKLTNMALNGQNGVTVNDVVKFESTGELRPEVQSLLNS